MKLNAIILAAGKGTRMRSLNNEISKVGYPLLNEPLVNYVIDSVEDLINGETIVVIGFGGEYTKKIVEKRAKTVWQREQKGTGHAVMQAAPILEKCEGSTFVLSGDVPLLRKESLEAMIAHHKENNADLTILTAKPASNFGYGRIIRDERGFVIKIVEQKDANEKEKLIKEVNAGTYLFNNKKLFEQLKNLNTDNKQGELYLTDTISLFIKQGYKVTAYTLEDSSEMLGTNDRAQLAEAESLMRKRINTKHMLNGVSLEDPQNTYIGPYVEIGQDTYIGAGVHLLGKTKIGINNRITGSTHLENTEVGENNIIISSHIVGAKIGNKNTIGPMARMRGECVIGNGTRIGNFVEFKNVKFADGAKCAHLTYLGDTIVEENANIGCGTITANYDGYNKFVTHIGKNVFIGSGTTIIAPVTIKEGAFIAAGSTINKDVGEDDFAIARERQINKEKYANVIRQRAKDIKDKK